MIRFICDAIPKKRTISLTVTLLRERLGRVKEVEEREPDLVNDEHAFDDLVARIKCKVFSGSVPR